MVEPVEIFGGVGAGDQGPDNPNTRLLQLMLVSVFTSWNSRNKGTYSPQVRLYCVLLKKIMSV